MREALSIFFPLMASWYWLGRLRDLSFLERFASAAGCAIAIPSLLYWLWLFLGGTPGTYQFVDIAVWVAALISGAVLSVGRRRRIALPRVLPSIGILLIGASLVTVSVLVVVRQIATYPHGGWDAWAIWNLRARFLAAPDIDWRTVFQPSLGSTHTDYPLLLPSAVARAWVVSGTSSQVAPIAISIVVLLGVVGAVVGSLYRCRGAAAASIGFALIVVPQFLQLSVSQVADVPLALFAVLAVSLVAVDRPGALRLGLAGAAVGCCAWTKNEGLIVAAGFPALFVTFVGVRDGWRPALQSAMDLTVGLGPLLVVVALFKIFVAPANDLVEGLLRPGAVLYWTDPVRVWLVVRLMLAGGIAWGGWWSVGPVAVVAALWSLPWSWPRRQDAIQCTARSLVILQLIAFFVTYVMTPHSVAWHIGTSWARLVAQMWPVAVWAACCLRFRQTPRVDGPSTARTPRSTR